MIGMFLARLATTPIPSSSRRRKRYGSDRACRDPHEAKRDIVYVGEGFNCFPLELRTEAVQSRPQRQAERRWSHSPPPAAPCWSK